MASSAEAQLRATYFLLTVSIIGTFFVICTVIETRKAAEAAWRSVDIAQQGITDARVNTEKQLRAYVHVYSAIISHKGNVQTVHLELHNFGQTPANKIMIWCNMAIGDLSWQGATTLPTKNVDKQEVGVMGPTAVYTMTVENTVLVNAANELDERRKGFFVWGEISYKDAFGQPQTTGFRNMITGRSGAAILKWGYAIKATTQHSTTRSHRTMDEEENLRRLLNTPPQPKAKKPKAGGRRKRKAAKKPRR